MTINQRITLTMADLIDMLDKSINCGIGINPKDITITDYTEARLPETPKDTEGVGEDKCSNSSKLLKKSNILAVLKEGLKAANAENKYPKNAKDICQNSMDEVMALMSNKEYNLFDSMINTKGFDTFALLWQKYQSIIQAKL